MSTSDSNQLRALLDLKERRLYALEKQHAAYGMDTPAHIMIELDLLRPDIQVLRDTLGHTSVAAGKTPISLQPATLIQTHRRLVLGCLIGLVASILFGLYTIYAAPVSLEATAPFVTAYSGKGSSDVSAEGTGDFSIQYDENKQTTYFVRYDLPTNSNPKVWSGITFKYVHGQDLTAYKTLEVTVQFNDPGADCNLVIVNATHAKEINLKDISSNRYVQITEMEHRRKVSILLDKEFLTFQPNMITEIKFEASAGFPRGEHTFSLSNIYLLR